MSKSCDGVSYAITNSISFPLTLKRYLCSYFQPRYISTWYSPSVVYISRAKVIKLHQYEPQNPTQEYPKREAGISLPHILIIINPCQILFVTRNPPLTSNFKHTSTKTYHGVCSKRWRLMLVERRVLLLLLGFCNSLEIRILETKHWQNIYKQFLHHFSLLYVCCLLPKCHQYLSY